jgi:hypothetical protein
MKTSAFFTALVTTISIVHFARAASVGGAGYTNDFIVGPGPADWGTSSRSGSSSDAYNPDIEVNTINVAGVNGQLAASLDNPPLQAALATWSSSGLYIQTRATANPVRCLLANLSTILAATRHKLHSRTSSL